MKYNIFSTFTLDLGRFFMDPDKDFSGSDPDFWPIRTQKKSLIRIWEKKPGSETLFKTNMIREKKWRPREKSMRENIKKWEKMRKVRIQLQSVILWPERRSGSWVGKRWKGLSGGAENKLGQMCVREVEVAISLLKEWEGEDRVWYPSPLGSNWRRETEEGWGRMHQSNTR